MSQREQMSQLNKTETDVESLIVAVGKQRIIVDLSAMLHQLPRRLNVHNT